MRKRDERPRLRACCVLLAASMVLPWASGCDSTSRSIQASSAAGSARAGRSRQPAGAKSGSLPFDAAKFENLYGGKLEPEYNWVILMIQHAGFSIPVPDAPRGRYTMSIFALNFHPGPVELDVVDGDQPENPAATLARFRFAADNDTWSTETQIIRLREGVKSLRVRFTNDSPMDSPFDRNATIRHVRLNGPIAD